MKGGSGVKLEHCGGISSIHEGREKHLAEYRAEQAEVIRQVHDRLTGHLGQRFSIESLSRQYRMNPTT